MKNKKAKNQTTVNDERKSTRKSVPAAMIAAVGMMTLGVAVVGCKENPKYYDIDLSSNLINYEVVEGEGSYKRGEKVTIKAEEVLGYTFDGWFLNGELVSTSLEYSFVVDGECSYEARYSANEVDIVLTQTDNGTITINDSTEPAKSHTEEDVVVKATAEEGYYCHKLTYKIGENGETVTVYGDRIMVPEFADEESLYVSADFRAIPTEFSDGILNYTTSTIGDETILTITGVNDDVKTTITELTIPEKVRLGEYGTAWDVIEIADGKHGTHNTNQYSTEGVFFELKNITKVYFPANSKLKKIGVSAFACTGITEITLPESVEEVGEYAFFTCNNLVKADFSKSKVTKIVEGTFSSRWTKSSPSAASSDVPPSYSLKEFIAPECLIEIGDYAFKNTGLTKLDLSNTAVTSIGAEAFYGCGNMLTAHMPTIAEEDFAIADAVSFGENAFAKCSSMYIFEAKKVGSPVNMFADCMCLVEVVSYDENNWNDVTAWGITNGFAQVVKSTQLKENGDFITRVTETEGEQTTIKYEIIKCIELDADGKINFTNLELPQVSEGVKLEVVVGPDLLNGMKKHTISNDPNGENGDVVHELEDLRNSLTGVVFSDSITEIADYAFHGYGEIVTLDLSPCVNLTRIGELAFAHCTGILGEIKMPNATVDTDDDGVADLNKVTEIGGGAFARITKASIIDLSKCQVTTLGAATDVKSNNSPRYGMFQESKAFYEIKLPESLKEIGEQTFSRCAKLITLTIPSGVEKIDENAFKQISTAYSACASLVEIVFDWKDVTVDGEDPDGEIRKQLEEAKRKQLEDALKNMGAMQPFSVRIIRFEDNNEDGINDNSNIKVFDGSYYFYNDSGTWYFIGKRAVEDEFLQVIDLNTVNTELRNAGIESYTIPAYVFNDESQIKEFKFSTEITTHVAANAFNRFVYYYVATGTDVDFTMHITNKVESFDSTSLKDFMGKNWVDQVTLYVDSAAAFTAMTVAKDIQYVDEIRVLTSVYEANENTLLKDATKYTTTVDGDYTVITPVVA